MAGARGIITLNTGVGPLVFRWIQDRCARWRCGYLFVGAGAGNCMGLKYNSGGEGSNFLGIRAPKHALCFRFE